MDMLIFTEGVIFFGNHKCPNDEWDHYVEFSDESNQIDTKVPYKDRLMQNINKAKNWIKNKCTI